MKNFFLSAFSLLTCAAILSCSGSMTVLAEEAVTEYGTIDFEEEMYMPSGIENIKLTLPETEKLYSNYSGSSYNYGDVIDANNKAVYLAFSELVNPSTDEIIVKLAEPITYTETGSETDDTELYDTVFSNCGSGIYAAILDLPELFWLDFENTSMGVDTAKYTYNRITKTYTYTIDKLIFQPSYLKSFSSLDEVKEYKTKLEDAVENFEVKGTTRYEKLKSIHDRMSEFTYYETNAKFDHNALGSLVEPGTVCDGYSKGFKMICDRENIPCICIIGYANEGHMWNYVLMEDNKWYGVDVTWDDCDGLYNITYVYDYFLKGSNSFFKDHTEQPDQTYVHLVYPEISVSDYDPNTAAAVTTTTTAKPTTTTTTQNTTTTAKSTTTTTKTTTTTAKPTTTTTTKTTTTTTAKPTTTTTTKTTTTTAKPTTTTTTKTTTTTAKPTTTTTAKPTTTTTTQTTTTKPVTTTTATEENKYPQGDVNCDGRVSMADLVYCSNVLLGKTDSENSCDVNGDGFDDSHDLVVMRNIIIEKYYWFLQLL